MTIEIDSFDTVEFPVKGEKYPRDWYARKDTIYRSGEFLIGNWGRPASSVCSSMYSKPVHIADITSISIINARCGDGSEIVGIVF